MKPDVKTLNQLLIDLYNAYKERIEIERKIDDIRQELNNIIHKLNI